MKRIKKFVALALAASMVFATASTAFAAGKSAQTDTVPSNVASTEDLYIPMYKENGKWEIDPMYAYIGIKNLKWNSLIEELEVKKGAKKLNVDVKKTSSMYALLLSKKSGAVIVPRTEPLKTPDIIVNFWVHGSRQAKKFTEHEVTLKFVKRESPLETFIIGGADLLAQKPNLFATTNSEKFYKYQSDAWKTIRVALKPYLKNLKLVAIRKDGRKEVIRSSSGRKFTCAYNLKELKAIEIRYTINRKSTAWKNHDYYNYLKDGVTLPVTTGHLYLNIK
jgi:hypothetical protein